MWRLVPRWVPWVSGPPFPDRIWKREYDIFTGLGIALICLVVGILDTSVFAETRPSAWEKANTAGMEAYRQGRYSEAKRWFLEALAEAERSGEPSPSQAMTLISLATVHETLGESEEAELRYQQSLFVIEAIQGPNHPDLVPVLNNLARLYLQDGKIQQVEPLQRRSLSILEYHLGASHAHLIPSLLDLAHLTLAQGRLEEAETYYAKALKIADSELDSRHHQTTTILKEYAVLLRLMNRNAEATVLEDRAQAIREPQSEETPGR